ncbi:MAG: isochorismatase family protein [Armatimonadota bacterium]|nr:isochorismatase family protein [Armatimonadota bacterium]
MMAKQVHLVIIDPQIDFCDSRGALYVQGAEEDIHRLSEMVRRIAPKLDDIHVTLDSHRLLDVAHPIFWKDSNGAHPAPFTIITAAEVGSGRWTPVLPGAFKRMLAYVRALETGGRYPLCIWPPHCLIGSPGHAVVPELHGALQAWEMQRLAMVDYVTKGSNPWTEHYSAVCADVPDPSDPGTQINTRFIGTLLEADTVVIAGEAGSHCLANTVRDIANNFGDDSYVKRLVLLQDATSPVPGFETFQDDFIKEMEWRGMQVTTTVDFLA